MAPSPTRRAARTTAAIGGVLAAALALPGGAAAQTMYQADDNGVLAFSTSADHVVHTIFTDGSRKTALSVDDPDTGLPIRGVPNEWSVDGSRLLVSDTTGDLQDVMPWSGQHVKQVDEVFAIRRASMSPDGRSYAYGSTSDGARLLRDGDTASTSLFAGASDGTAWSNNDHLLVAFDGTGLYRFHDPVTSTSSNNAVQTDAAVYPSNATISRDGTMVAYNSFGLDDMGPNSDVVVARADGTEPPSIPETGRPPSSTETFAAISPDGEQVAFVSDRQGGGQWAIYLLDIASGNVSIVPGTTIAGPHSYQGLSWQPADVPNLAEGSITTTPAIGGTIKQDAAFDIPTGPVTTTWQWQRCTNVTGTPNNYTGGDCVDLGGETGEGYTLLPGDVGAQFRVIRTVTNGAGTDTQASEITEPAYVADATPPGVPTITTKPATRSGLTSPAFTWTGTESGGTFRCSIDEAAFTACTSGSTFPISGDGPHRFRVRQVDAADNAGDPAEHTWTLDTAEPGQPTIDSAPAGTTKSTSAQITFTGDEPDGSFECRVGSDAAPWEACTSPAGLTGLTEGAKRFSVRQLDEARNASDPEVVTWTVDTTGPLAPTLTTTPGPRSRATAPAFAWTGAEGGGSFECSLDGAAFEACASGGTVPVSGESSHALRVRQVDAAGNPGTPAEHTWVLDTTRPQRPAFVSTPGTRSSATSPSFTWTGAEGGGTFECSLDGGAHAPCASGTPVPVSGQGPHTFEVRQVDAAGNEGEPAEHLWTLDTTGPAKPTVTGRPASPTNATTARFVFTGEPDGSFECRKGDDAAPWEPCGSPLELTDLSTGDKRLSIRQLDEAGNEGEPVVVAWTIDRTPPLRPAVTTDLTKAFTTASPQLAFTGEEGAAFECAVDDGTFETCTSPTTLSGLATGDHWFSVRQLDAAGNRGPARDVQLTVDSDVPARPAFTTTPAAHVRTAAVAFGFTGSEPDGLGFECSIDGIPGWEPCESGVDVAGLPEGEHTFRVREVDVHGRPGEAAAFTWTYDGTPPATPVVLEAPAAETTSTAVPGLEVAGEEGAERECRLDDRTWADCAAVLGTTGLGLGVHELAIRLRDKAGNVSEHVLLKWTVVAPPVAPEPGTPSTPEAPAQPEVPSTPETPAQPEAPSTPETPAQPEVPSTPETPAQPEVPAKPVTLAEPDVPARPEAPAKAADPAPDASPKPGATPARPTLTALIGGAATGDGKAAGGQGPGSGTSSAATVTVDRDGVRVGCAITGTVLTSCKVDLHADAATGAAARAAAVKRVLVGTGTSRKADGSTKMEIDVRLNATGRALLRKAPGGLRVLVAITGQPVEGAPLKAEGVATLVRRRTTAVVGGFAVRSAVLTTRARQQLATLARQVRGTAVAIRVVGHTDGSSTDADYLQGLGKRRARAVAAFLRARGVQAKATLVSQGARRPVATNATTAGRAKNRRVELRIDR